MQQQQQPPQQGGQNPYINPQLLAYKRDLGVPDFTPEQLNNNPQMKQQYLTGDQQLKWSIESQWLDFQVRYFSNERVEGRWYPALGPKEQWEQQQRQTQQQQQPQAAGVDYPSEIGGQGQSQMAKLGPQRRQQPGNNDSSVHQRKRLDS